MLKLVLYVVIALLVLSFFGVSLQHLVESPTTHGNFSFLGDLLKQGWDALVNLVSSVWHSLGF